MGSCISVTINSPKPAASHSKLAPTNGADIAAEHMWHYFKKIAAGNENVNFSIAVSSPTSASASGTVAFGTFGNLAAGDTVTVNGFVFTCSTSAVTVGTLAYRKITSSTLTGDSLAAQINGYPALKGLVTAANSSGTVTITAVATGEVGNAITTAVTGSATTVSGATLAGGLGQLATSATGTITVTYASILANDTITIGDAVLTCVTGTPAANQFKKVTDLATTIANLAAAINLSTNNVYKYVSGAVTATGVVTITAKVPGIVGNAIYFTASNQTGSATSGSGLMTGGAGGVNATSTLYRRGY